MCVCVSVCVCVCVCVCVHVRPQFWCRPRPGEGLTGAKDGEGGPGGTDPLRGPNMGWGRGGGGYFASRKANPPPPEFKLSLKSFQLPLVSVSFHGPARRLLRQPQGEPPPPLPPSPAGP